MLRNLHVKNMALMREIDIDFAEGLNILTGETGAGKSILIGSIQLALGGRLPKDLIREGAEPALVEVVFDVTDPSALKRLQDNGIDTEDGLLIASRRIDGSRSSFRLNGHTVTAQTVRDCLEPLIDIHGQHDNQTLLKTSGQLHYVDLFGGEAVSEARARVREAHRRFVALKARSLDTSLSEDERLRQMDFLRFEIADIEEAALRAGEDEEVEAAYKKMRNARLITEAAASAHELTGYDRDSGAGETIGKAIRELDSVVRYDPEVAPLKEALDQIDSLLNDFNRDLAAYLDDLSDDPEAFAALEDRLNTLNRLKAKYGPTIPDVLRHLEEKKQTLSDLMSYEEERERLNKDLKIAEEALIKAAGELTAARQKAAASFEQEASRHFLDLNFARADFRIDFSRRETCTENGCDEVEFLIATNPGSPLLPLREAASGGELSRLMLGIRTMFATRDETGTLIFDEIDTGISGRTAQCVAEKLNVVARSHQTICITHLPQIAAMADHHYAIIKDVREDEAVTRIEALDEEASIAELARLIGGASITETTLEAAGEMRQQSLSLKH